MLPINFDDVFYISSQDHEEIQKRSKVDQGDIIMAMIGTIGNPVIVNEKREFSIKNVALFKFGNSQVFNEYFYYLLHSSILEKQLSDESLGVTQKFVSLQVLRDLRIPLPPLEEQKRIAEIARKCDRIRRIRRFSQQNTDTYLQSVFLEMFGDPLTNPMHWNILPLGSQIKKIESGWSPVCDDMPRTDNTQWAVLRLGAITSGKYQPGANKMLPENLSARPELEVHSGDFLITRKNTHNLVAACTLVHQAPPRLMLPDTVFRFVLAKPCEVNTCYLWGLFSEDLFRKKVQALATGTAGSMPNISKEKFLSLTIPIPPLHLQEKFAQVVKRFERIRTQQREAERQAEHLFQTVLHRAFRGEL